MNIRNVKSGHVHEYLQPLLSVSQNRGLWSESPSPDDSTTINRISFPYLSNQDDITLKFHSVNSAKAHGTNNILTSLIWLYGNSLTLI